MVGRPDSWQAARAMARAKTLMMLLMDDAELLGKPFGRRLALVCPNPNDPNLLNLGIRTAIDENNPIIGLDGGEGYSDAMDLGADVWWVAEPLENDRDYTMLCFPSGEVHLQRVNVEFAGTPSEAVDYLVRTPMYASAAVFGATIYSIKESGLVLVGDLGVAISTGGSATAGRGGVAISLMGNTVTSAGRGGIAIGANFAGTAITTEGGQSYVGYRGVARAGSGGLAVAGRESRVAGTHVVVGDEGEAEVLDGNGAFAAGTGSRVHLLGTTLRAGVDYEPKVAYRVRPTSKGLPEIDRCSELDELVDRVARDVSCGLFNEGLARYFLDHRPLESAAARRYGDAWTLALRSEHGPPQLPEETQEYLRDLRRSFERLR